VRIWKCGLVFSAKMKVGLRWAAAEAPSLGGLKKQDIKRLGFGTDIRKGTTQAKSTPWEVPI
jgi:hypothetical protein